MESVGKSFDVDGKFREIEGIFGVFKEDRPRREYDYDGEAIKIVSGLTDILKEINQKSPNKPNNRRLVDRVCKFIDEISEKGDAVWDLSRQKRSGEILFSFLNELAVDKKFVPQIDRIFRSGDDTYPLVNWISCEHKEKFNELFKKLPEWYQNKLLGETISYEEGGKTYTCSLIGGTALMGFQSRHKNFSMFLFLFLIIKNKIVF